MLIYLIKNLANGKVYVGQTIGSLRKRLNDHIQRALHETGGCRLLCRAIRKHGRRNFVIEVLTPNCTTAGHTNSMERYWIKELKANNPKTGYNLTKGGEGTQGYHHTERARKNISKTHKGAHFSKEHRRRIGLGMKGNHNALGNRWYHTEDARRRIRKALLGNSHRWGRAHV